MYPWKAFDHHISLHLQCWQHLASECEQRSIKLFRLRPKCHYLQQIGQDTKRNLLNPRLMSACFYDESFLGYVKRIATQCHSSSMIKSRFWQRYYSLPFGLNKTEDTLEIRVPGCKTKRLKMFTGSRDMHRRSWETCKPKMGKANRCSTS